MKKALEVPLVLIVSIVTVSASATAIHDANAGKADPILKTLQSLSHTAMQWFHAVNNAPSTTEVHSGEKTKLSEPNHIVNSAGSEPLAGQFNPYSGWSSSDVGELESILHKLYSSTSLNSLQEVYNDMSSDNVPRATTDVERLLNSELSSNDKTWLEEHFHGAQAFNTEDVNLLEQAMIETAKELTPSEKHLAAQQLSALLGSTTSSVAN